PAERSSRPRARRTEASSSTTQTRGVVFTRSLPPRPAPLGIEWRRGRKGVAAPYGRPVNTRPASVRGMPPLREALFLPGKEEGRYWTLGQYGSEWVAEGRRAGLACFAPLSPAAGARGARASIGEGR